ncbi:DUF418 domain-containing protein [Corynebacterium callunae]|uniref:DUF418 domain-containing protein n=1 Tax=Corynebacterium callunae TaxID=1721 RepID=UPI0009D91648
MRQHQKKIAGLDVFAFLGIIATLVAIAGLALRFNESLPEQANFNGHTGTPAEVVVSIAASWSVLTLCLLGAPRLPRLLNAPFVAFGSMPLTMYCLHVLSATYIQNNVAHESTTAALVSIVAGIVLALVWKQFFAKGPLEWLMAKCINLIVVSPQPRQANTAPEFSQTSA